MIEKTGNILIVDDDEDILTAARLLVRRHFSSATVTRDPAEIPSLLEQNPVDVVLLDMNFGPGESSGRQGLEWLERVLKIQPDMVVVMITAHGSVDTVVEAMKRGATDFISKPWQNEKVVATLSTAVSLSRSRAESASLRRANRVLREAASPRGNLVGSSAEMAEVLSVVSRAAPTDANVLILGENGTGKELVAREIHRQSGRANEVFLGVDLGSISETLFESELFGHRKGAFTGASEDRPGRFQAAHNGTLFLDEIGNLPLHLQAKLLSALETRSVTAVGSDRPETIDVRIIAATNTPVEVLRDERRFRPDLLFRLNTVEITVPPLRKRPDDILPIARHYVAHYSKKYGRALRSFSPGAEEAMRGYEWPGNVRALRHAVERAVILAHSDVLDAASLQLEHRTSAHREPSPGTSEPPPLKLEEMERQAVERALHKHKFNISQAARELGLTRASLYRRMEKHGL